MAATDSARIENRQMPIFARDSLAVCAELNLPVRDAQRLHYDGLLSFDPDIAGPLDESREAELVFLGALLTAGCSRAVMRHLLAGLRKPYCYDVRRLYYEWRAREWRLLPGEDDPEGAFFALLDRLRERQASEALLNLRAWVDEALELARDRSQLFAHANGALGHGQAAG